ncbi:MAG TPA: hypothetical protein VF930_07805 [Stellaceae bacterium]
MRCPLAVLALCLARAALGAEGELALGSGVNFTSGTYGGSESTHILTVPLTARYESEPWTLRATLPYLRISGPSAVFPGVGRVENRSILDNLLRSRTQNDRRSVSGLGDATASATYTLYSGGSANRSGVGLSGKLKFATGDENQGLGTGSNDVAVQVDAFQGIGRSTIFGAVGYTMFGDSPIANFDNVLNFGVGALQRIDGGDTIGVAFDLRQAGNPAPAPQRELTAFWSHRLEGNWRSQLYALKGFSRGSPDWGGGITAAYVF